MSVNLMNLTALVLKEACGTPDTVRCLGEGAAAGMLEAVTVVHEGGLSELSLTMGESARLAGAGTHLKPDDTELLTPFGQVVGPLRELNDGEKFFLSHLCASF